MRGCRIRCDDMLEAESLCLHQLSKSSVRLGMVIGHDVCLTRIIIGNVASGASLNCSFRCSSSMQPNTETVRFLALLRMLNAPTENSNDPTLPVAKKRDLAAAKSSL